MIMKVMNYIKINKIKLNNEKQKDHLKTRKYQPLSLLTLIKHNKFNKTFKNNKCKIHIKIQQVKIKNTLYNKV